MNKQQIRIAIDPGAHGGIAWIDTDGNVQAEKMPDGMTAQIDFLRGLTLMLGSPACLVEKVGGYMPGNSGPAAAKFSRHCGNIEAALYAFGVPVQEVAPGVWMRGIGIPVTDKKERKKAIKEEMARRYPHLKVTLSTADALGMLTWAGKKGGAK